MKVPTDLFTIVRFLRWIKTFLNISSNALAINFSKLARTIKSIKVNFDDYFSRTDCKRNQIIHLDSGLLALTLGDWLPDCLKLNYIFYIYIIKKACWNNAEEISAHFDWIITYLPKTKVLLVVTLKA